MVEGLMDIAALRQLSNCSSSKWVGEIHLMNHEATRKTQLVSVRITEALLKVRRRA